MRRMHDDQEREAQARDRPLAPAPVSRAARMLALQRTVGNHAVAALLAREAKPKQEAPANGLAIVDGIGTIPLLSFSMFEEQHGAHSARGTDREKPAKPPPQDVYVTAKQGEHSSALALASSRGDAFEVELFIGEKLRLKLHKAMIASYSMGDGNGDGPVDSWTFNAESVEFLTDQR
jgi:hypothetical protein